MLLVPVREIEHGAFAKRRADQLQADGQTVGEHEAATGKGRRLNTRQRF